MPRRRPAKAASGTSATRTGISGTMSVGGLRGGLAREGGMTIQQRRDDLPNSWRIHVRGQPARVADISWREDHPGRLHLAEGLEPPHRRASPGGERHGVFRRRLEKVKVKTPEEQGADLTVTWHPPATPDL